MDQDRQSHLFSITPLTCPVTAILGVWQFVRGVRGYTRTRSTPGHLLHLVIAGGYNLRTNGREYEIKCGDLIYYHESEEVEWLKNTEEVIFYSVGFLAPSLDPLPLETRVFRSTPAIYAAFTELFRKSLEPESGKRTYGLFTSLMTILSYLEEKRIQFQEKKYQHELWWEIEEKIRKNRRFRPSLDELAEMSACSRASVVRSCRRATGLSPMKRLQALRMAEARGLLRYSALTITQIAQYLSYPRIHEFSREFKGCFRQAPTKMALD